MKQAGILAGIGFLLSALLSFIPTVGWGLSLVGTILFFVGVYKISRIAKDERIFRYFLTPMILGFVGFVIVSVGVMGAVLSFNYSDFALSVSAISTLIIVFILLVISFVLYMRAFRLLAVVTSVNLFNTAATLYKWGAILLIVFGVGVILAAIGSIIALVGFFSIEDKEEATSS